MTRTPLDPDALEVLFTGARSHNAWRDGPLPEGTAEALWDLVKMGPTSANCSPGRFVFVTTQEGKEKLRPALSKGNLAKTMAAPMTVIVAHDLDFHEKLPELFPHTDARAWFTGNQAMIDETAMRNGTLQGAYLIMAARTLGLDTGPMSGFDRKLVDEAFFAGTPVRSNFLVNVGHGDPGGLFGRLPRLGFAAACRIA